MEPSSSPDHPVVGQITLRYWASVRALTGIAEENVTVLGPVTLAELVEGVVGRFGAGNTLAKVLSGCSVLVGDQPVATADPASVQVNAGDSVEFLPPFAGG